MAIDFVNPLTAGTVLVRSAIQSQNYIQNSSGWKVAQDGTAEFNNVTVRGTVTGSTINGGTINGSSINGSTVTVGTSPNPQVVITSSSNSGFIKFPSGQSFEGSPSEITAGFTGSGSTEAAQLQLFGPTATLNGNQIAVHIASAFADGSGSADLQIVEPNLSNNQLLVINHNSTTITNQAVIQGGIFCVGNAINITHADANLVYLSIIQTGDSYNRWTMDNNGKMWWGPGGATPTDTNLYRSAANTLKTDDSLVVGVNVSKSGASWNSPSLSAGWAFGPGSGGAYPPLQWRYDAEDNIHIFGCIHATSSTPTTSPIATGFPGVNQTGLGGVGVMGFAPRFQGTTGLEGISTYINNSGELRPSRSPTYASGDTFMFNSVVPLGNLP